MRAGMSNGVKERKACSLLASFSLPLSASPSLPLILLSLTFFPLNLLGYSLVHSLSHFLSVPLFQSILFAVFPSPSFFSLSLYCNS